jgi:hypothetical protein
VSHLVSGNRRVLLLILLVGALADAAPRRRHTVRLVPAAAVTPEPALLPPPPPALVQPAPRVETVRERRWGLFGGGLALFVAGYAIDIGVTYGLGHSPSAISLIPLVGPLIQMGDDWSMVPLMNSGNPQIDIPANERIAEANRAIQTGAMVILAVDFALQLAGLTMVAVGAAGRKVERAYASTPRFSARPRGFALTF